MAVNKSHLEPAPVRSEKTGNFLSFPLVSPKKRLYNGKRFVLFKEFFMLIKIFTVLSLLSGIGAAIGSSLWPLAFIGGFVGCFLGLIVLGFLIV